MRPASRHRRHLPPVLLLLLSLSVPCAAASAYLDFIYVDANAGGSSGGHAALKIGDAVYHFQNDQGYSRLVRDGWNRFRFVYNDIDNRNIHIAKARVDESVAERVRERFSLLLLVQNRHLEFAEALGRDVVLLDRLAKREPYAMPGLGFFARRPPESPALHGLRAEITRRFGPGFLGTEPGRLARELAGSDYRPVAAGDAPPAADRYPPYPATFAERTENLYAQWFALAAIREEWPLREGVLIDASGLAGRPAQARLSDAERRWLAAYRDRLARAVLNGLEARPPGDGFSLLLALARFVAVSESLATGRLLLLDPLTDSRHAETFTGTEAHRGALGGLLNHLRLELPPLRREVFALPEPDEPAYNELERHAAQIAELQRGLAANRPVRFQRQTAPPEGWGETLLPLAAGSPDLPRQARADVERVRGWIDALYPYELIDSNCVTELVRTVNSAFVSTAEAEAALGGHLEPGESLSYIPHRFFDLVRARYRVEATEYLPSYRNRMLRRFERYDDGWAMHAAEANVWTSVIYEPQPGDGLFLLFTEEVFWPRPLYGAVNLAYGLGGATLGLFAAPFDQGRQFKEGLRGALFSLPELAFGNIRKGSFDGVRGRMEERLIPCFEGTVPAATRCR